jgi:hypothetical protein
MFSKSIKLSKDFKYRSSSLDSFVFISQIISTKELDLLTKSQVVDEPIMAIYKQELESRKISSDLN